MFANLLGTLRTFDAKTKDENVAEKRAEIDKKVDEKIATDRTVGFSIGFQWFLNDILISRISSDGTYKID